MEWGKPDWPTMGGVIVLTNVARNQRFEAIHTVDVLGLMASGVCFGVAFALILRVFRVGQCN